MSTNVLASPKYPLFASQKQNLHAAFTGIHAHTRTHTQAHTHSLTLPKSNNTMEPFKTSYFCSWEGNAAKIPTTFNFMVWVSQHEQKHVCFLFSSDVFSVCKLPQINMTCVNININAVLAPRYCYSYGVWSVYCIYKYIYMALSAFCCALSAPQWSATILYKWCLCAHMLRPR